ncbi:MAG: hypothetical protein CMB80_25990 [Flammeovirgaceae bacterium]|nr:hypothetical protein [Flammeovirgaceae bacterium]|tara:strand:- start:7012 stop:8247 length:1236 start_codon:yes stop_codon:yes gene_type:complete
MTYLEELEALYLDYELIKRKLGKLPGGYYSFSKLYPSYSNANLSKKWRKSLKAEIKKVIDTPDFVPFKAFDDMTFVQECKKWLADAKKHIDEFEKEAKANCFWKIYYFDMPLNTQQHEPEVGWCLLETFEQGKCEIKSINYENNIGNIYKGSYVKLGEDVWNFSLTSSKEYFINILLSDRKTEENLYSGSMNKFDGHRIQSSKCFAVLRTENEYDEKQEYEHLKTISKLIGIKDENYFCSFNKLEIELGLNSQSIPRMRFIEPPVQKIMLISNDYGKVRWLRERFTDFRIHIDHIDRIFHDNEDLRNSRFVVFIHESQDHFSALSMYIREALYSAKFIFILFKSGSVSNIAYEYLMSLQLNNQNGRAFVQTSEFNDFNSEEKKILRELSFFIKSNLYDFRTNSELIRKAIR